MTAKGSITGSIKEVTGFIKEEMYEHGETAEAKKLAREGRDLRNEGRIESGKPVLVTPPGSGSKEAKEAKEDKEDKETK